MSDSVRSVIAEPQHGDRLESHREHGQDWVVCRACGRAWSVQGNAAEIVDLGDSYCDDVQNAES